jgi:hypothetical protein
MKYRALLLAPIFACVFVAPASSQAVIDNSDMCAQLYPDANCENYGPGNPYTGGIFQSRPPCRQRVHGCSGGTPIAEEEPPH